MKAEKAKIYGVDLVGSEDAADIQRTDDAVGLTFTVGESEIHSDFDKCYPWSDMREVVDDKGNVFVRIPKFYAKISKNNDGTYKYQISGYRYDGFSTLFIDGEGNELDYVDVGKYEGSMENGTYDIPLMRSVSGATCKVNITIGDFRKACMNNGKGYQQYDYLIHSMIQMLFLVEFATTNTQAIMYGYAKSNSAAVQTGRTDEVATPSGSPVSNSDGKHACKYRGMENLWGNLWKWCDGISFDGEKIYICTDPAKYADESYEPPYIYVGNRLCNEDEDEFEGNPKAYTMFGKMPLLGYCSDYDGSTSSYFYDYQYDDNYGTVLLVSATWSDGGVAGLWCASGGDDASNYFSRYGGRLCRKPL